MDGGKSESELSVDCKKGVNRRSPANAKLSFTNYIRIKKRKKHMHGEIVHKKINNAHLENRQGEFSFRADLDIMTTRLFK